MHVWVDEKDPTRCAIRVIDERGTESEAISKRKKRGAKPPGTLAEGPAAIPTACTYSGEGGMPP